MHGHITKFKYGFLHDDEENWRWKEEDNIDDEEVEEVSAKGLTSPLQPSHEAGPLHEGCILTATLLSKEIMASLRKIKQT